MGMVGGGKGAFVGAIHRHAVALDGEIELVCGGFSRTPEKARASGKALGISDDRNYSSYQQMFESELKRPEQESMDFVAIVAPNHMHFLIAHAALSAGFHVICDKPVTLTLHEAMQLAIQIKDTQLLFGHTQTYIGYPMVKEAKNIINQGKLESIRKVIVEYTQGWLTEAQDRDNKQASWRGNPKKSGISGCMGDIGSHAANLAEYISGEHIDYICTEKKHIVI